MPEQLLTRAQVAELLQLPVSTVAGLAYKSTGPRYFRVGRHTRYRLADVLAWLEEHSSDQKGVRA